MNSFAPATRVTSRRASFTDAIREPFRLFFPQAIFAGMVGVALWPWYFWGFLKFYPNLAHVRLMTCGFFGGFIFGFLGTALPRMLSASPFEALETTALLALHGAMIVAYTTERIQAGDALFLSLLGVFALAAARRFRKRRDTLPPGFILVGLAFVCAVGGAVLAVTQHSRDPDPRWLALQRLLSSQGFVLLPILGIGPFILPRILGVLNAQDVPDTLMLSASWRRKAWLALSVGLVVIASFFFEVQGGYRTAYAVRSLAVSVYLLVEFPLRATGTRGVLGRYIRPALWMMLAGFVTIALWPIYRVGLMHLTLAGGFAIITFLVATRVVFGHSGNLEKLKSKNRWVLLAVSLMILGVATRISGDFWARLMASHYSYGAVIWIVGVAVWSWKVLPKIREVEPE